MEAIMFASRWMSVGGQGDDPTPTLASMFTVPYSVYLVSI